MSKFADAFMSLGPGLAIGAAQAATTYSAARRFNRSIDRAQASAIIAAQAQQEQVNRAAALERQKRIAELQLARGRLRVSQAAAGVGFGGSYQAFDEQLVHDAALSIEIEEANARNRNLAIQSRLQAELDQLAGQFTSPGYAGVVGGLQGFTTGLDLGRGLNSLYRKPGSRSAGGRSSAGAARGSAGPIFAERAPYGGYGVP